MKLAAVGLATLVFVGTVWWLARGANEERPRPRLDAIELREGDAERETTTKVPPGEVAQARVPKLLPDEADWLEVAIVAAEGPSSQALTVPGIELEVGVAGEPATPTSMLESPRLLARVVTDEEGRATTRMEVAKLQPDGVVWARVSTLGYQSITAWKRPAGRDGVSLQVVARAGGTVRGSVQNRSGQPVGGARATLLTDEPEETGAVLSIDEVRTGSDGAFALHFFQPGVYHVQAAARGFGSGSLRDLELRREDPPRELVVVVHGTGVLAGSVRDPGGEPIQAFELSLVPVGLERFPGPHELHANEWSDGLYADRTRTDAEGRFYSAGLKPGAYFLLGSVLPAHPPEALHDEPFTCDDTGIELVVGRHRLELEVIDAQGQRVRIDDDALHRPRLAQEDLRVFAQESDAGQPHEPRRFVTPVPDVAPDGTVIFTVLPERSYLVGALDAGRFVHAEVFVPRTQYRVRQELRLPEKDEPAELSVRVLRPDGEPMAGSNQVYVHELTSGRLVARTRVSHQEPNWTTRVPAGRYVVRAEAEPMPTHRRTSRVAEYAPDEELVELSSGGSTEVELRLRGSGRLSITLDLPPAEVPPGFWQRAEIVEFWKLAERLQATFRDALDGRVVELVHEADGTSITPVLDLALPGESPIPALDTDWIYPGATALTRTPLPPGEYRIRVEGIRENRLTVRAGETTPVVLR